MSNHTVKVEQSLFQELFSGARSADLFTDGRVYQKGEIVELKEVGADGELTGLKIYRKISRVQKGYGLSEGAVVVSYATDYATPSAAWRFHGQPDPHEGKYDCGREDLTLGHLTDDELANGAFMNYDNKLDIQKILDREPGYYSPIGWMTAVKERIRWLSRQLEKAKAGQD